MTTHSMSTLADKVNSGRYDHDPGMQFLRRPDSAMKNKARGKILGILNKRHKAPRSLRVLTMPSINWEFEKALLASRETKRGLYRPQCTTITAIEQSLPLWTAGMVNMPRRGDNNGIGDSLPSPIFAQDVVRTSLIYRYFLCSFEEFALSQEAPCWHHAAWLDFCGPITSRRLVALQAFWNKNPLDTLIVTSLNARWSGVVAEAVKELGVGGLLLHHLEKSSIISEIKYADGSPMHQIILSKRYF